MDLFKEEQPRLRPLNPLPYDIGRIKSQRASKQFRVALDSNNYSVPAEFASQRVTVKAYPDRVCIYHQDKLIARHVRSYDRHQDIEDPDHPKALLAQRRNAREQRLLMQFLSLSRHAQAYVRGTRATPRQPAPSPAQDRGLERDLRRGRGRPGAPGRHRLRRLQLRVHRQYPGDAGPRDVPHPVPCI